jgi:uncharacterized protein (UPF0333 family)
VKNKEDVIQRIEKLVAFNNNKKQLFCSDSLTLEIKKKLTNNCIWNVVLYGSETWTLGENIERVVNSFQT